MRIIFEDSTILDFKKNCLLLSILLVEVYQKSIKKILLVLNLIVRDFNGMIFFS